MAIMSPCGGLLTYRTSRMIRIDVWQLGLAFRLIQAAIVGFVAFDIFQRHGWAYSEVPAGRVNAYGESTAEFVAIGTTSPAYCSSADHDYVFSSLWSYIQPGCRKLDVAEIYNKNKDSVSFTTSIIESVEYAWPCAGIEAPFKRAQCAEIGAPVVPTGLQCKCVDTNVYYVKGVEAITVAFEHGYTTTPALNLEGDSAVKAAGEAALDTELSFPNGTKRTYVAGETIRLTLAELVSISGENLDATNPLVAADARGTDNKPRYRTTGMSLTVDLKYSNLQRGGLLNEGETAPIRNANVDATLAVSDEAGWAGSGPVVFYAEPLRFDAQGTQTLAKMTRHRQGVVVSFRSAGLVYAFYWQYFINELLAGYLFLAIAVYIADFVAFYLLPNGVSTVLRAKRAEKVSRMLTFAQLGLKAAVAVKQFQTLDTDDRGYLEVRELVAAFGSIPQVSKENALLMAQSVMRQMTEMRAKDPDPNAQDPGRMSFNEFMSLIEGATSLDFDQYVRLVHTVGTGHQIDQHEAAAASEAYDAVEAGVDLASDRKSADRKSATEASASASAAVATRPVEPPVGRLTCYLCKMIFGVPNGARHVRCPRCQTINSTEVQPTSGLLRMPSFGGNLVAPAPQQQMHVPQQMQPMQQAWGGMPTAHVPAY